MRSRTSGEQRRQGIESALGAAEGVLKTAREQVPVRVEPVSLELAAVGDSELELECECNQKALRMPFHYGSL